MHQCLKNENCLKCVFCQWYLHKDCCITEQALPKNTASDKSVCMPCNTKFNINNLADISVHDLTEPNTSRKPDNMVSNPTCEHFFDNCGYYDQKSFNNLTISTKGLFIMYYNIGSLQKNFDILAYYLSKLEQPLDGMAISATKITKHAQYLNIKLQGYSFLHCDSKTKAGRVAFDIKESLLFSRRNNIKVELQLVEDKWIEIKTNRGPVVVEVVHRHPTNSTCECEKFSENLFKIFYELNLKKFPLMF